MIGYYYYTTKVRSYFAEPKRASYTFGLLTLLTITLFGLLVFKPLLTSTVAAYSELRAGAVYETGLTEKIIVLDQAALNFSPIAYQIAGLEKTVPQGSSQPELIKEFSQDAGRAGVTLGTISFKRGESEAKNSILFNLFATAPTGNLRRFLEELERGRLITLESVKTTLRENEGQKFWDISIEGRALFVP